LNGRRKQCLLNRVFGGGEVTETADDRTGHLRREFSQQMLGVHCKRARVPALTLGACPVIKPQA